MPVLKIGLDDATHRKFKVWCVENGSTMQGAVVGFIGKAMGEGWGLFAPEKLSGVERVKQGGALERVATAKGGSTPPPTTVPKPGYELGKKCKGCGEPLKNSVANFYCVKCQGGL